MWLRFVFQMSNLTPFSPTLHIHSYTLNNFIAQITSHSLISDLFPLFNSGCSIARISHVLSKSSFNNHVSYQRFPMCNGLVYIPTWFVPIPADADHVYLCFGLPCCFHDVLLVLRISWFLVPCCLLVSCLVRVTCVRINFVGSTIGCWMVIITMFVVLDWYLCEYHRKLWEIGR